MMNENYVHPPMPEGSARGHPARALPPARRRRTPPAPRVQLLGSGAILREVLAAAELLRDEFGVHADVWSATSFTELRRDGLDVERWNLLHPEEPQRRSFVEEQLGGRPGPVIAATD